ncbi:MAG: FAD:protein FMN transferase, partial [Aeromicrobium sp.]
DLVEQQRWIEQRLMTASAIWNDWSCRVRVTVTEPNKLNAAKGKVTDLMAEVSLAANRFEPTSDISRINAAAGRVIPVSGRTIALVDAALDAAAETGGAVDPTIGSHLEHAGYARDIEQIRERLVLVRNDPEPDQADWTRVRVDHDLGLVGIPAGLRLDLGATAKSWTADLAAHMIANSLNTGVLVEIGGDVAVAGSKRDPWQVGVSERAGEPGQRIGLTHGGLATSSTAARRWRTATGEAHHIIDPRTGRPVEGVLRTATVWAPSALSANTASTAAIILGDEAWDYLLDLGLAARLVDNDGRITTIGDWPAARREAA